MAYYPLTQEEREKARTTDLAEYLRCCGEEVKRSGSEYQWLNAGRKVTLRGNLWFDQYEQMRWSSSATSTAWNIPMR